MDLNFNNKLEEYYQKFIELQDKLKRSEEQRFVLEMKFNEMVQVTKEEEQAHYRKLRAQYKKFLDEDQKRQDRNERIIRNLERIEAKISILSAKTERISLFRRQYQKYLQRIADSYPEKKITDARISRERSFIKEEPLKELQQTLFMDDYSLPERPSRETHDNKKPIYEHLAVKKSLEKDRSNEEKIEILDRYLQSISSQKCRDILNKEQHARKQLSLDTPLDKVFKDDFTSSSTNHATAVADDIMNSIYSRYYTKVEVAPKENKVDSSKSLQSENHEFSDYVKTGLKLDDEGYLDSLFNKKSGEKSKPTLKYEENITPHKTDSQNCKESKELEKTFVNDFPHGFKSDKSRDQNRHENLTTNRERTQDTLKNLPENPVKSNKDNYENSDTENKSLSLIDKGITRHGLKDAEYENKCENLYNVVSEMKNDLTTKNEVENIDLLHDNLPVNNQWEKNKNDLPHNSSDMNEDSISKIPNHENGVKEKQPITNGQLGQECQEEIVKCNTNNEFIQNQEPLLIKDQIKHESDKDTLEHNSSDQLNPVDELCYVKEHFQQSNQQNGIANKQYNQESYENRESSIYPVITQNNENDQRTYNNEDQSFIQYQESDKSEKVMQNEVNSQPQLFDRNQQEEDIQPNQYDSTDRSLVPNDENAAQPVQFNETGQPTEYLENDQSYQQVQYNENDELVQYNENDQPMGYDQYGQPVMYDQNGQIVQPEYDENGQFVPQYDKNGQIIILYDHNGQQLFDNQYKDNQQYDLDGQPIAQQYDENGQPIYDQNQIQYYDYPNQYQGDDQAHYIEGQLNDHSGDAGNQVQTVQTNYYEVGDQGPYLNTDGLQKELGDQYEASAESHEYRENVDVGSKVIDTNEEYREVVAENYNKNIDIAKPSNVMDILDTDTESTQQNTSKISNSSDFDFS